MLCIMRSVQVKVDDLHILVDAGHVLMHNFTMNKLPLEKRIQILSMLCEGSSMRSISRVCDVSINTVTKLLVDAGFACAAFHNEKVRGVVAKRIQCDEIWSFTHCKQKRVATAKAAPIGAGDTWTWTGICAPKQADRVVARWWPRWRLRNGVYGRPAVTPR